VYSKGQWLPVQPLYGRAPEQFANLVADMGTEVWNLARFAIEGKAPWASEMVPRTDLVPLDLIPRVIRRCHERNVLVYACDQLCEPEEKASRRMAWAIHPIDDGRGVGPDPGWVSFLSPYRQWKGQYLAEASRVTGVDGFYFDATPFASRSVAPWAAGDIGPYGQEVYKRETGKDVPKKVDWNSRAFKEWVNWRYDKTVEFFQDVTIPANEAKPHFTSVMNYYTWGHWYAGQPLRRLGDIHWCPSIEGESNLRDKVGRSLSPRTEM
jgi:hypothetical protein